MRGLYYFFWLFLLGSWDACGVEDSPSFLVSRVCGVVVLIRLDRFLAGCFSSPFYIYSPVVEGRERWKVEAYSRREMVNCRLPRSGRVRRGTVLTLASDDHSVTDNAGIAEPVLLAALLAEAGERVIGKG